MPYFNIKRFGKLLTDAVRLIANVCARIIIVLFYYIIFLPLAIWIPWVTDFLERRDKEPAWLKPKPLSDIKDFLQKQS